jgi:hypothetical protein
MRSYIADILKDRRAVGEYQPRLLRGRHADGEPIPNYFPAVVSEEKWLAARAGAAQRRRKPGRIGKHINIFSGLLRHARDGDTYFATTQTTRRRQEGRTAGVRVLRNDASSQGKAPCFTFPFPTFEAAVLSCLREINPRDILNGDSGPDESLTLAGELAEVERSIALLVADLETHGDSPTLFARLREKETRKRDLSTKLAEVRQKAAHPLSEAWGECQSLAGALESAPDPDDARLRLRSAIRRIVDSIWLLIVPRGWSRLCALQVWFADGKRHRDYLILSRHSRTASPASNKALWWVKSFAEVAKPEDLDLRRQADAKKLEKLLASVDLEGFRKA